ncbi:hypothetical protein BDFB_013376 [Asbolus verrucosus]|uniref:Uncharacterized protein n=1 Tax=Asbolus verrucosus TaxID=1661398 RepID=A0A482VTH1_ASBVE|nr:hypothetical protein BDFB_013376 [Asbolus verrucosus]
MQSAELKLAVIVPSI